MTSAPNPNPRFALEADAEYEQAKSAPTYQTIPRALDSDPVQRRPVNIMSVAVLVLMLAAGFYGYGYYAAPSSFASQSAPGKTDQSPSITPPPLAAAYKGDLPAPLSPTTP